MLLTECGQCPVNILFTWVVCLKCQHFLKKNTESSNFCRGFKMTYKCRRKEHFFVSSIGNAEEVPFLLISNSTKYNQNISVLLHLLDRIGNDCSIIVIWAIGTTKWQKMVGIVEHYTGESEKGKCRKHKAGDNPSLQQGSVAF